VSSAIAVSLPVTARRPASAKERADGLPLDVLDRVRAGDEAAFRELYTAVHPQLLRYLQVRSPFGAEDVAAETWLHVVRDLPVFRGTVDDFRAWVFTLARHRAVDAARHRSARPAVSVADLPEPDGRVPSAEQQALDALATQRALAVLATLPGDQAELVMLRVVLGLDVAVVAEIVGRTPGAVRVAVHRALRSLSTHPDIAAEGVSG
jgi:RNA polymerase sigma-70 factor, ECF subfamily